MKTDKILMLISPIVFLPMFVICIGLGMNSMIVTMGLVTYTVTLLIAISK